MLELGLFALCCRVVNSENWDFSLCYPKARRGCLNLASGVMQELSETGETGEAGRTGRVSNTLAAFLSGT